MSIQLAQLNIPKSSLESILDFLPYPFLLTKLVDGSYHHLYFNQQFLQEIGYTIEEVPDIKKWFMRAYPEVQYRQHIQQKWTDMIQNALTTGESYVVAKARIFTKNNGYKWFEVKSSLFVDGFQFVSFVNIDDVLSKDEQLVRANQNKNKMLSILSHDLRSSMINLHSLANMAVNKTLSATEFAELAAQVKERSALALELLDTTVHWTRSNFENVRLVKQPVSLKAIVRQILEIDNTHRDKQIKIILAIDDQVKPITDHGIITIIVRNLISNAVKFTPVGGKVELKSWTDAGQFYLSVKDSGTGMDPKLIAAVLSDQYSPATGTLREKGSGVGLTLCRDLLKKINGTLAIESEPGKGTEVRIALPL